MDICKKETMLRATVIPDSAVYHLRLSLPEDYVGKELEVIIFAKHEGLADQEKPKKQVSFTVLKTQGKTWQFNREEANER